MAWSAARLLIIESADLPRADCLAVLAGSGAYVERTKLAAQLFNEGRAPKILLTGDHMPGPWSTVHQRNLSFAERAVAELRTAGVPSDRIEVLPQRVSSTHDEAVALREYAVAHNLRSLLVVTSAYHSRRARWTLRRAFAESGVEVGLSPVSLDERAPSPATWWLSGQGWSTIATEYVKLVYYRLRY